MLTPHTKQIPIIASKARFKVIRAGRRSGKTILAVERMIFDAVSGNNRNIFYLAPTQTQARDIIWEILKNRVSTIGEFNEQRLECKLPTKDGGYSLIRLSGWENRENFRGKSAYHIFFDELDTMRNFFIAWQEIFRPALMDSSGYATFMGTPKKENPNLRRLEKFSDSDEDYACFKFTTLDNPHLPDSEKEKAKAELDQNSYRQEILAEYVDNAGSLFKYESIVDVFTNTVEKYGEKFLIIDVADDGTDKTVFSFWEDLEEYRREEFAQLNTEGIVAKVRDYASQDKIPFSHIAVDAIGVGSAVASNSNLSGIIGYKSSYGAMRTDIDPVRLPNVHYTNEAPLTSDYKNLRSQCVFTLSELVNNHLVASRVTGKFKELVIEELASYQDASVGDGKRMATQKDDVKSVIGRSPDHSDTWIMRMYFVLKEKMLPDQTEEQNEIANKIKLQFNRAFSNLSNESNK